MKSYCSIFEFLNKLVSINLNFRMTSISNEALLLYDKLLDMERLWKILKFQTQDVALIRLLADMDTFINHLTKEMFFSGRTNYEPETKTKNFHLSFRRQQRNEFSARTFEPNSSNRTANESQTKIHYEVNSLSDSILLTELELKPELQTFLPGSDHRQRAESIFVSNSILAVRLIQLKPLK